MKWTLLLVAVNILVFYTAMANEGYYISEYGFSVAGFFSGRYWTVITSMFIHADLLHIAGNMAALLALGFAVEGKTKAWQFFAAYFLAGIAGCLSAFVPIFGYPPGTLFVGASAAISGLVGLGVFMCPGKFVWFPEIIPLPFAVAGSLYLIATFTGLLGPGEVAYSGHLFGLLAGAGLGIAWAEEKVKRILEFALVFMMVLAFPYVWKIIGPFVLNIVVGWLARLLAAR